MAQLFCFTAYGLVLESTYRLALPAASRLPLVPPSPVIQLVAGAESSFRAPYAEWMKQTPRQRWFHYLRMPDGWDYVRWPKLFEFLVAPDGKRILARQLASTPFETLQTYLLGQILSFALLRLGIETLHGTTVALNGKAVAFLGDCGYGKSTLAAAFLREGFSLLTDDLLVIKRCGTRQVAYPGSPRLKLMPRTACSLLGVAARTAPINPFTSKQIIPLGARRMAESPLPLQAMYALTPPRTRRSRRVVIRRLNGRQTWQALTANTFNLAVREPNRLAQQFTWAHALARQVPVNSLSYPRSLRMLPQVVERVIRDVPA